MEENLWCPARAKFSLLLSSVWLVWEMNVLAVLKIIIYYYLSSSGNCYEILWRCGARHAASHILLMEFLGVLQCKIIIARKFNSPLYIVYPMKTSAKCDVALFCLVLLGFDWCPSRERRGQLCEKCDYSMYIRYIDLTDMTDCRQYSWWNVYLVNLPNKCDVMDWRMG